MALTFSTVSGKISINLSSTIAMTMLITVIRAINDIGKRYERITDNNKGRKGSLGK